MAEINPPLYVPVSLAYGSDELGLPFRDIMGEGVVGAGDLAVTQRAAGVNKSVDIAAGACWVKGDDDANAQPAYRARSSSVVNLATAANASGQPRIDLIVAHVKDATFSGALNSWALEVLQGTPTAGATLANALGAAAVPNNAIVLARVLCANGYASISNAEILDMRARSLVGGGSALVKGGAAVATKISELAAGTDGALARLRLQPASWTVGSHALPVATLNVRSTAAFPTAGVVETPNGDITYTGKTASTLTGCSGGTGTLAALSTIRLKPGNAPINNSYPEVLLVYDATLGKWVSTEYMLSYQASGSNPPTAFGAETCTYDAMARFPNYIDYVAAGLAPQTRLAALNLSHSVNTSTGHQAYCSFNALNLGAVAVASAAGRDTALEALLVETCAILATGTVYPYHQMLWHTWPAAPATPGDALAIGLYAKNSVGSAVQAVGKLQLRWVG